jgi:hypothetical protein
MTRSLAALISALLTGAVLAAQMPNVAEMSGIPLPTNDLPDGAVSVRLVRGDLSHNVVDHPVELHGGGQVWKATTDQSGRATFTGLPPATSVHALTLVDGQKLESLEFTVPPAGGVRVVLVAAAGAATAGASSPESASTPAGPTSVPAPAGALTLAGQSRFILEIQDEAIDVYALLEITNAGTAPVDPGGPLVFEIPAGATGATVLEGSSPQATADPRAVRVVPPFAPGTTLVQMAYRLPYDSSRIAVRQTLPVPLGQTTILVKRVGDVSFSSPQTTEQREAPIEGQPYLVVRGPGLPAGGTLEMALAGLPHHPKTPRYLALALALLIVGVGTWFALDGTASDVVEARTLDARREQLFAALVKLEEQHAVGRGDATRYHGRRRELLAQLEQVYARLDEVAPAASLPLGGPKRDGVAVDASLRTHRA